MSIKYKKCEKQTQIHIAVVVAFWYKKHSKNEYNKQCNFYADRSANTGDGDDGHSTEKETNTYMIKLRITTNIQYWIILPLPAR